MKDLAQFKIGLATLAIGCLSFVLFEDGFLVLLWQAGLLLALLVREMLRSPKG